VIADDPLMTSEGDVNLRVAVARIWLRRWWVIGASAACGAIAVAIAFLLTPTYKATTVLAPAKYDSMGGGSLSSALGQLGGLASLAGLDLGGGGLQVEESLAVLRSRGFTQRFIVDQDILRQLFPKRWDGVKGRWRAGDKAPTPADGARYFEKKVRTLTHDKKTGLVTLSIEWRDPATAAQWANQLVAQVNAEMRARAIASTSASLSYLQKELDATVAVDTRQAINRLVENQINQRMFANVTEEYAFRIVDRALTPEREDRVFPNKALFLVGGGMLGLLAGAAFALVAGSPARRRARAEGERQP
jgi:uncharacterized protein involved in exopolysaccharide biosynthesis